ncbi:hypothetical protein AJ88_11470 [Mesorhizobium amorphae CCBAU 01583]|nr:hypothetical protein AJ88_11470 [Mesorhizobium amorphae CCBAU 01583]
MTADGLVREAIEDPPEQPGYARVGRPGIMLELVPDAIFFLGVEIGVEHISTVEIDLEPTSSRRMWNRLTDRRSASRPRSIAR